MLKCNIKRGSRVIVKSKGTIVDLTCETAALIHTVYQGCNNQKPEAAQEFKRILTAMLTDPESPVWKEG